MNQNQIQNENLTSEQQFNLYVNQFQNPNIFNNFYNIIFNTKYTIKTEKQYNNLFDYIEVCCYLYNKTKYVGYYNIVVKMVEDLFNSSLKSKSYLGYLLKLANDNNICASFNSIIIKNMFKKQLEIQEKYRTRFYNTNTNTNSKPFVTILIISHGIDLTQSMPYNDNTNTLMFNLSSVPNVVAFPFSDDELEVTLNYIMPILNNKPSRYVDIVNNLTELKENYITYVKTRQDINDYDIIAKKYIDYACRVTKPIKDKELIFTNILNPGIYVVAGVNLNLNITEEHDNIINLLIPEDLAYFNELFNKDSEYGSEIFHNSFDEFYETFGFPNTYINENKFILLSSITSYFNSLGINNVGYIDFSCRGNDSMCDIVRNKQMVLEEMGSSNKCGQFPVFGGKKRKSRKSKNKK
jgi:hypothetical protein